MVKETVETGCLSHELLVLMALYKFGATKPEHININVIRLTGINISTVEVAHALDLLRAYDYVTFTGSHEVRTYTVTESALSLMRRMRIWLNGAPSDK